MRTQKRDAEIEKKWRKAANQRCSREDLEGAINWRDKFLAMALSTTPESWQQEEDGPDRLRASRNFRLSDTEKILLNEKVTKFNGSIRAYAAALDSQGLHVLQVRKDFKYIILTSLIVVSLYIAQIFFLNQAYGWQAATLLLIAMGLWIYPLTVAWIRRTALESDIERFESDLRCLGVSLETAKLYLSLGDYHAKLERMGLKHAEEKISKDFSEMTPDEKVADAFTKTIAQLEKEYFEKCLLIELISSLRPLEGYPYSPEDDAGLFRHPNYEESGFKTPFENVYLDIDNFLPRLELHWNRLKKVRSRHADATT